MILLSGGTSIRSDEMPDAYTERICKTFPMISSKDVLTVFETAQEAMYSSRMITEAERNEVLKAHGNIRNVLLSRAGIHKKIWIVLRYPSLTGKNPLFGSFLTLKQR